MPNYLSNKLKTQSHFILHWNRANRRTKREIIRKACKTKNKPNDILLTLFQANVNDQMIGQMVYQLHDWETIIMATKLRPFHDSILKVVCAAINDVNVPFLTFFSDQSRKIDPDNSPEENANNLRYRKLAFGYLLEAYQHSDYLSTFRDNLIISFRILLTSGINIGGLLHQTTGLFVELVYHKEVDFAIFLLEKITSDDFTYHLLGKRDYYTSEILDQLVSEKCTLDELKHAITRFYKGTSKPTFFLPTAVVILTPYPFGFFTKYVPDTVDYQIPDIIYFGEFNEDTLTAVGNLIRAPKRALK